MNDNLRNLSKVELMPDGAYLCKLEQYDSWNKIWETIPYVYRSTDISQTVVGSWIKEQIDSNTVTITEWVPPLPITQSNTSI